MEQNEQLSRSTQKQKKPKKKRKIWSKIFWGILILISIGILTGGGIFLYYAKDTPDLEISKLEDTVSSNILDSSGELILTLGEKKRETIEANQIPEDLKNAITSIEDKRFERHIGIDPIRIFGSAISNLKGNSRQGGSTLTQQLIKLSYFSTSEEDQTIERKVQEAWLSVQLERKKSKDEILTYYINKVYMANGLYGMETASEVYYGKTLQELSLPQTALLAGMPQAPNDYDPYTEPDNAKFRRDMVLSQMLKDNKINQQQYEEAIHTPIDDGLLPLSRNSENMSIIDNYLKEVIAEVEEKTGKDVYRDGMDIYTNIDMDAQTYLYNLVNTDEYIQFPSDDFQTAVTVIDVNNGQVKAQIGGRKIAEDVRFGENLAVTAQRDVGSTVKPLTDYAPAIEEFDFSTAQRIIDESYTYPGTNISVQNYDKQYLGTITMRQALVDSRNIPAVKMLDKVGLDNATAFLQKVGIEYEEPLEYANAISGGISSLQLAAAYAAFANGGTYYKPYYVNRIVMQDGQEEKFLPEGSQAMKDSTAFLITDMLKDVINNGTGTVAKIDGLPQAGKTGTSNYADGVEFVGDYGGVPDITFAGYTTNYSISVWTGNSDYTHAISPNDTTIAAKIYRFLMSYLSEGIETPDWQVPENVTQQGNEYFVNNNYNAWSLINGGGSSSGNGNGGGNYNYNYNSSSSSTSTNYFNETPSSTYETPSSSSIKQEEPPISSEHNEIIEETPDSSVETGATSQEETPADAPAASENE